MIISLNWLKQYVDIKIPTNELVELIDARLVEVEEVVDLSPKYKGIKIVEVKSAEHIAGSDHLSKCQIWDGQAEIQVVCGAPNVRAGMLAVWLAPGVTLPATYNQEPLVLAKRKIMGVESNGMLAAMDELDLGTDHAGIIEINPADAKAGDDFAEVFGLNDTLLDIENKSLTHRPDTFGVIGFAREIAGILGQKFEEYEIFSGQVEMPANEIRHGNYEINVEIADPELCPRYQAVVMDLPNKPVNPYLTRMQTNIARSGMRSIDSVVDSTNDLMLMTGQPLHAFDYDKLVKVGGAEEAKIIVRAAKNGERLELLDDRTIEMTDGDIVITSNNVPVALAGAMGGKSTAIDKNTRRIVVESATFNMFNLRGTQFRHGIFSEAITRFTKGQPPALTDPVIKKFIAMTEKHYGLRAISEIVDKYPKKVENPTIDIMLDQINGLLGTNFTYLEFEKTLTNVGYKIWCDCGAEEKCPCEIVHVQAPWWRTDIHIPEDIIEDIGRINGYDNIIPTLPTRDFTAVQPDPMSALKQRIRETLASFGANEVLTYSFVSGDLLKKVGQDAKNSYKIINSISPELQYVRQQIVPNLLEKSYQNLRAGFGDFALFEINQIYRQELGLTEEKVPKYYNNLALILADKNSKKNFYDAKKYLAELGKKLGIEWTFREIDWELPNYESYFEPKRSAAIELNGIPVGICGEIRDPVCMNLKVPTHTSGFEISLDDFLEILPQNSVNYQPIARYQGTSRDLTFQVKRNVSFAAVKNLAKEILDVLPKNFSTKITPIDIFAPDEKLKNVTLRIDFTDRQKTIDTKSVAKVIDDIAKYAAEKLDAKII
ncbi:phenylalanine--tRNA ligase subunit beta [Candidatus Saccharibacteria bacterium]|nr:phenylalanine--tRNA ligase subunit beta [Candidatus Saccharibacteria bacterium]